MSGQALIIGALLRMDLRGFAGDLPAALGTPMRDEFRDGLRSLTYDLEGQIGDGIVDEACARLALWFDRHFIEADVDPFEGAAARRMKLELGLMVDEQAEAWSCELPANLLDCLGALQAPVNLSFYPQTFDEDAVEEEI
jgi:hypothetical protein